MTYNPELPVPPTISPSFTGAIFTGKMEKKTLKFFLTFNLYESETKLKIAFGVLRKTDKNKADELAMPFTKYTTGKKGRATSIMEVPKELKKNVEILEFARSKHVWIKDSSTAIRDRDNSYFVLNTDEYIMVSFLLQYRSIKEFTNDMFYVRSKRSIYDENENNLVLGDITSSKVEDVVDEKKPNKRSKEEMSDEVVFVEEKKRKL